MVKEAPATPLVETTMVAVAEGLPLSPLVDPTMVVLELELPVLGTRAVVHRVQQVQAQVAEVAVAHAR